MLLGFFLIKIKHLHFNKQHSTFNYQKQMSFTEVIQLLNSNTNYINSSLMS